MGLLLSVLVACVGVLEVIACVRHFQDGYLPLWTPHCAVTSGYAISTERWRKRPSESYEFRSSNDVSESLNHTDDQQSGTYIETSQSVQNGGSGKQQFRDTDYHKSVEDSEHIPFSTEHEKKEAQVSDDIFEHERDEVNLINKNIENLSTSVDREQDILYEEDCKTQRTTASGFVTDINSLIHPDDIDTNYSVLTSSNVKHTEISPSIILEQNKKDTIVQDLTENYPRTISEVNVGHEGPLSVIGIPQSLSCDVNNEQFLGDDSFAGSKHIKQFVPDAKSEENVSEKSLISNIEIESLTNKEEGIIGIPQDTIILGVKDEYKIPSSTSIDRQVCRESPEFCSAETSKTVDVEQNVPFSDYKSELEIPLTTGQSFEKIFTLDTHQETPVSSNEEKIQSSLREPSSEKCVSSYEQDDLEQRNIPEEFTEDTYVSSERTTTEQHAPTESNQSLKEDSVAQFPEIEPNFDLQNETVEEYPNIKADLSSLDNLLDGKYPSSEENLRLRDEIAAGQQPSIENRLKLKDDKIADQYPSTEVGLNLQDDTPAEHSTEQHLNTETNFGLQENVCSEQYPTKEEALSLQEDVTGPQQDICKQYDEPETSSFSFENEQQIYDTVERIQTDVSESRLVIQTTSTEPITPEKHLHEDISVFDSTVDLSQGDIHKDLTEVQSFNLTSVTPLSTDTSREPATSLTVDTSYRSSESPPKLPEVQSSSLTSVTPLSTHTSREPATPLAVDTSYRSSESPPKLPEVQSSLTSVTPLSTHTSREPATPLTVDTSYRSSESPPKLPEVQSSSLTSVTPLSTSREPATPLTIDTSYRSSMSPPKLPSTPRRSKADISWPTFFPGAPVIKRPSVSFATPEAVFTPEDQEILRQYEEESPSLPPCIKKTDDVSTATDSETTTTSTTEDISTGSAGLSDRSDSIEEDPFPITFKERSPSNIVAGNDFSRKELQLQRKKSYKHKRYSSAIEIRSRDEEAEDRSFSEDRKGIVRASSVRETRRRHRKPAKASSFEDVLLRDTTTEVKEDTSHRKTSAETAGTPIPEGKETELLETQEKEDAGNEETKKESEVTDNLMNLSERIESKSLESKPPDDDFKKEETAIEGKNDAKKQDEEEGDEEDYSVSEEQSSSQQTPPRNEAFWVSSEDVTH